MKTIVETNTGKLLFSTDDDNYICLENQSKIDIHLTEMFVSPFFDFQSNSYYEGATSEEIAQVQTETQEQLKQQQYTELLETDWYVVRFAERGIPIPTEILEQRQAIREKYQ